MVFVVGFVLILFGLVSPQSFDNMAVFPLVWDKIIPVIKIL
jgi:hypothetical protein